MPVYNPFQPQTYQQKPKPPTTESPSPPTATPARPGAPMLEGVAPSASALKAPPPTPSPTPPQPQPQQPPAPPKPGKPVLEGLTAQSTGTAQPQLPTITPSTLAQPGGLGSAFMSSAFQQSISRLPPGTTITWTETTTTKQLTPAEKAGYEVGKWLAEHGSVGALSVAFPTLPLMEKLLPEKQRQALQSMEKATSPIAAGIGLFLPTIANISQLTGTFAGALGAPKSVTQYFNYPAEFWAGLNLGAYEAGQGIEAPRGLPREAWQFLTGTPYITPYSVGALAGYALPIAALKAPKLAEVVTKIDPAMLAMTGVGRGLIRTGAWLESAGSSLAERLAPRAASLAPGSSIYRLGEFLGDITYFTGKGMRVIGSALTPLMIEREPIVRFERVGEGVFKPELELVPTRVRPAPIQTGISEFVPGVGTIRITPVESRVVGAVTREGEVAGARGVRTPLIRALVEELPPERAIETLREVRYVVGYPGRLPIETGFLAGSNVEFERAQADVLDALRRLWQEARAAKLGGEVLRETRSPRLAGLVYQATRRLPVTAFESARFGSFMREVEETAITSKDFSEFMGRLANIARKYGLEPPPSGVARELYGKLTSGLRTMGRLESEGLVRPGATAIRFVASELPGQPYLLEYGPARAFGLGETGELVSVLEGTERLPRVGYAVTPYGRLLMPLREGEELPLPRAGGELGERVGVSGAGAGAGARTGTELGTQLQQLGRLGLTREQLQELVRQAESMGTRFSPIGGAGLGALARTIEEVRQRQEQQPPTTGGAGGQVSVTIQRPETTPRETGRETGRETEGGGGYIRIGGGGGGGGDTELEEYWTWVIPYERHGLAVLPPPYTPIKEEQITREHVYVVPPPPPPREGEGTGTRTGTPPVPPPPPPPPPTETPVPPTAIPTVPPFLIPLLGYPWMPSQYPTPSELARPGTMREILVL